MKGRKGKKERAPYPARMPVVLWRLLIFEIEFGAIWMRCNDFGAAPSHTVFGNASNDVRKSKNKTKRHEAFCTKLQALC